MLVKLCLSTAQYVEARNMLVYRITLDRAGRVPVCPTTVVIDKAFHAFVAANHPVPGGGHEVELELSDFELGLFANLLRSYRDEATLVSEVLDMVQEYQPNRTEYLSA